mmetsp:Transcript_4661/g.9218  ORF Transcript_4661/g.9218 Transcript_4661/m.9218 type:complete len:211 (-) Transcript_4661:490-1122(-)
MVAAQESIFLRPDSSKTAKMQLSFQFNHITIQRHGRIRSKTGIIQIFIGFASFTKVDGFHYEIIGALHFLKLLSLTIHCLDGLDFSCFLTCSQILQRLGSPNGESHINPPRRERCLIPLNRLGDVKTTNERTGRCIASPNHFPDAVLEIDLLRTSKVDVSTFAEDCELFGPRGELRVWAVGAWELGVRMRRYLSAQLKDQTVNAETIRIG